MFCSFPMEVKQVNYQPVLLRNILPMTSKVIFSIASASLYLLVFLVFVFMEYTVVVSCMFLLSPLVILWMAYTIIRHGVYSGKELGEKEEWGYEDKKKEDLGLFW